MLDRFAVLITLAGVVLVRELAVDLAGISRDVLLAAGNFDTPLVFACVVCLTVMGIALFYTVGC